ncbi:hypothetical protein FACS1894217_11350 [Clostridia bacterium]|nr:hypothetical protein FACS1894217_11350 [Clostridia bacterium]
MAIYTVDQIKEKITPIAREYGVERVMLFGSYARGEATEQSDIDLLIARGRMRNLLVKSEFMLDIKDALGKDIDVVSESALKDDRFTRRVRNDVVRIYG